MLVIIIILNAFNIFGQDSYRDKNYDEKIYLHQMEFVEANHISKEDYIRYSKSLSKWDSRPILLSKVWIMDELQPSSIVPNFFWGSFSRFYNVEIKDAMELPQLFLENARNEKSKYIDEFAGKKSTFDKILKMISSTEKNIFLSQRDLKRIDNLYYENGKYWKYIIPEDSPYPISDSTIIVDSSIYTTIENNILETIDELGIYAIYNDKDIVYFLVDGLLDNSFGYVFQKAENYLFSNHLFEVNYVLEISPNYYFYISN